MGPDTGDTGVDVLTEEARLLGFPRRYVRLAALALIIALALALRMYGLNWDEGIPFTPHPDERAIMFKVAELSPPAIDDLGALLDAEESTWNPKWFPYGSFPLYLLRGVQLASEAVGAEITDLRVTGRVISGLADVATLLVVFLLGSRLYSRRVGLLAAGLLAVAVLHIQLSHYFAVDTLQAMFAVVALLFMYRVARHGGVGNSALAGLFIGLGLATKASQLPIFMAFGVAQLMYLFDLAGGDDSSGDFLARLRTVVAGSAIGLAVAFFAFFIAQPYALLDWTRFKADFTEQSEMVRRIRDYPFTRQYADTIPYWYLIKQHAVWGLGLPLGLLAWGGGLFVAVRGLSWRHALGYVALGLVLPAAILIWSNSIVTVGLSAVIATAMLLATLPLRRADTRIEVLFLAWVVPYFLITGAFEVKFMRYVVPITPFLILFGSRFAFAIWEQGQRRFASFRGGQHLRHARWAMIAIAVFIAGSTAFYALAYMNVYSETHTAVRASDWINDNVRKSTLVLKEHWEEGLPGLHAYRRNELPMYDPDGPLKLDVLSEELADAETLVFFSNRLYGTLPRIAERYPASTAYYKLLFSGRLGYELADFEATYPSLLGVSFVHDTFSRPGLPVPEPFDDFSPSAMSINLGHADESFSVYDHPTVLVFNNVKGFDAETIRKLVDAETPPRTPQPAAPDGPVLTDDEFAIQVDGGTWTDIFSPNRWMSRVPVLAWLLMVEGLALLALPLTFWLMRPLPDRGFLFAKAIGILFVSVLVWLLASLQWVTFSPRSIALAAVILAAVSGVVLTYRRDDMVDFVRRRWSLLLIGEIVFLAAFFAFLGLRMANPDLWHPFRGGEKPMDLAYLNAVTRSTIMPPLDPWFSGGFLNYYYFGQFITGMLIKATGIDVRIAYNLAIPLFYALTVGGAFSLVYNLAESSRRRLMSHPPTLAGVGGTPTPPAGGRTPYEPPADGFKFGLPAWGPVWAGLAGVAFVAVLGNLDGVIQVGHGLANVARGMPFGEFNFWQSSRMMAPDPPGFEINEFPFFTYLFADLHAHLMAIPFTLLALGLALSVVLRRPEARSPLTGFALGASSRERSSLSQSIAAGRFQISLSWLALLAALGVVVGALRVINTWDYPTYLIVAVAAVFLAGYFRHGGLNVKMLGRPVLEAAFVFLVGYLVFLPFHLRYEVFFSSLETTTNTTVLWQFLAISGLPVFILGSFYLKETWSVHRKRLRGAAGWFAGQRDEEQGATSKRSGWPAGARFALFAGLVFAAAAIIFGFVLQTGSTVPFLTGLVALVALVGVARVASFGPTARMDAFLAITVGLSLLLAIGLDVWRVEGDIDRMNTVFKTYLQIWVMLGVGSAYALWRLSHNWKISFSGLRRHPGRSAWALVLVLLVAGTAIYPIMGTQDRLRDRFQADGQPLTLDGMAYMREATFTDEKGPVSLVHDLDGITWMQRNIAGSPVIAEAHTPTYRWGGRISVYTGLPSVIGWQWHQEQQRWDYRQDIAQRIFQVNTLYQTPDPARALQIIDRYDVEYVYVGELEKRYYPEEGIAKFEGDLRPFLDPVYTNEQVTIYRVLRP
jgi:YYY domain-containing protein